MVYSLNMENNTEEDCSDKKMDCIEKVEEARHLRYILHEKEQYSEERSAEAAIEFSRLEVQVTIVLLGIMGVLGNSINLHEFSELRKFCLAFVLFLLVLSLTLGLLHLKVTEQFWDQISLTRAMRFNKWNEVVLRKASFQEALAYQEGTKIGNGTMVRVPEWTWKLQTICLGVAIVILLTIAISCIVSL